MTAQTKGLRLLEIILVLGIGIAIVFATIRYFNVTRESVRVTRAIHQIKLLKKASYAWLHSEKQDDFSGTGGGTAVSLQQLVYAGKIKNNEKLIKDPWQGDVIIQPGSDPEHVHITLTNIPKRDCKLLSKRLDKISKITEPPCNHAINEYTGEF